VREVANHLADFGEAKEKAPRHQTAEAVADLLEAVRDAKPAKVIESLANLKPQTSEDAMASSFASAAEVVGALAATQWKLFESIRSFQDDGSVAAKALLARVSDALKNDQHVTELARVLRSEQSNAIDLLTPSATPPQPPTDPPIAPPVAPPINPPITPPVTPPVKGKKVVDSGMRENLSLSEAESEIAHLRQKTKETQVTRINVSWVIEE
jgi:hypothetical protein